MTVTAINSTSFTVTIGDPSMYFYETSDKLIDFQIVLSIKDGPAGVADTDWTVEE